MFTLNLVLQSASELLNFFFQDFNSLKSSKRRIYDFQTLSYQLKINFILFQNINSDRDFLYLHVSMIVSQEQQKDKNKATKVFPETEKWVKPEETANVIEASTYEKSDTEILSKRE